MNCARTTVETPDLLAAWTVLENPAVSLDQIGSAYAGNSAHAVPQTHAMEKALAAYFTPELLQSINDARMRIAKYMPGDEAEALSDRIDYWQHELQKSDSSKF